MDTTNDQGATNIATTTVVAPAKVPKGYTLQREGAKGSSLYSVWTKSPKAWTNHGNVQSAVYGVWTAEGIMETFTSRSAAAIALLAKTMVVEDDGEADRLAQEQAAS